VEGDKGLPATLSPRPAPARQCQALAGGSRGSAEADGLATRAGEGEDAKGFLSLVLSASACALHADRCGYEQASEMTKKVAG